MYIIFVVQSLSCVQLFVILWIATLQAPLSSTLSWNLFKFIATELVMLSNHFIICCCFLLLPSIFPTSWFFASGSQSIGDSASASVLPMNIQDWFPLGLTGLISWLSKGLSRVFSSTTVQKHQFFHTQPFFIVCFSHPYMTTEKTTALTIQAFVSKVMSVF